MQKQTSLFSFMQKQKQIELSPSNATNSTVKKSQKTKQAM